MDLVKVSRTLIDHLGLRPRDRSSPPWLTGAADNEAYFAVPGDELEALVGRLLVIARANQELEAFHRGRLKLSESQA